MTLYEVIADGRAENYTAHANASEEWTTLTVRAQKVDHPARARRPLGLGVDFFLRYAQIVKGLELSLQEDSRILEIGSGAGGLAQFFADREVIGVDEKEFALGAVSANLTVVRASATRLPFANASFGLSGRLVYLVCLVYLVVWS